eukprot:CAMPEP_0198572140 /NCGR_PEP_ID=MMETSP1462-20131121/111431_1 /TAXON_ID=1333877 /ORGANISM="Brandtodinium nutriculum, Strain RCC3387" /LENGTH=47 /DNA_ID= /DNA_START= /DNA_END= /DNA_ORIENTATION=
MVGNPRAADEDAVGPPARAEPHLEDFPGGAVELVVLLEVGRLAVRAP